uniref:Uncharacterized protein n=1 Tax=Fagus sylvatica TaxID=28930 RepID=A0A2N9GNC9_FAGSY
MDAAISIGAKTGEYMVEPIGQQVGYLIHLNSNIKDLKDQFQKLGVKRRGVQLLIDEEKRNAQVILPEVNMWVEERRQNQSRKAEKKTQEIDAEKRKDLVIALEVEQWVSDGRQHQSRKAKKKTLAIEKLLSDAPSLNKMSCPPPPQGIGSSSIEGKTTMAKEVAKRTKDDKLFDEVVMSVVSQNQDLRKIQGQIADMLGLELKKESETGRADQLKSRLMLSKSVLVILDDVWDVLNLEEVGIPYGGQHNRCKILLTSRSEEACNQMKTQKIFQIKVLSEEEAWNLFREMAGDCVDTLGLHPIAKEVAKECGALPVAIVTVARALENKTKDEWIAAREQLKKSIPKNIPGLHSKVYSSIEFSYSYLKSDEAKSCFLLCCLFPEDFDIPIEYLVRYGVGRRLFAKIDNVAEARSRVHAMVNDLKRSFLLLDSEEEECVKMHDVVRDVAISIADKIYFLHPDGLECPKLELLQLSCGKDTPQMLPANMFQGMKELKVLSMRALGNLEILSFLGSKIKELPREIGNLGHLKLLDLSECSTLQRIPYGLLSSLSRLEEFYMTALGGPTFGKRPPNYLLNNKLTLGDVDASDIKESRLLCQLLEKSEILELRNIKDLKSILYELHQEDLPCLKVLTVYESEDVEYVIDATSDQTPRDAFPILESLTLDDLSNLKEIYHGQFPREVLQWCTACLFWQPNISSPIDCNRLKNVFSLSIARGLVQLQELYITRCTDMEEIFSKEGQDEKAFDMIKFPQLKHVELYDVPRLIGFCTFVDPIELVQPSHAKGNATNFKSGEFQHEQHHTGSFPQSGPISNKFLSSKTIFWSPNLGMLDMWDNDSIEVLFDLEGLMFQSQRIDVLAQLKTLRLEKLSKLMEIRVSYCHKLKTFGSEIQSPRKQKKIKGLDSRPQEPGVGSSSIRSSLGFLGRWLECVPHCRNYGLVDLSNHMCPTKKSHGSSSVNKEGTLTKLKDQRANVVDKPLEIWSFFPSNMIECLKNLEVIELEECHSIEAIFQLEELNVEENHVASVLNQLRDLKLDGLPKMMHIWKKGPERIMGFENLRLLEVRECNSLTYLFSPSIAKLLVMLEEIQVIDCQKIEEILARAREEGEEKESVSFEKVNLIVLDNLPNLECFCNEANAFGWPSLKKMRVESCPTLRTFVPTKLLTPQLERVYEDDEYKTCQWKGDLNATIEHIFKGKETETSDDETVTTQQTIPGPIGYRSWSLPPGGFEFRTPTPAMERQ